MRNRKEKYQELIDIQLQAKAAIEAYIEQEKNVEKLLTAKRMLKSNEQILYKLGHRKQKQKKEDAQPRKNPFKIRTLTEGQKAGRKIENKNVRPNPFKETGETKVLKSKAIENKNIRSNPFKKEDAPVVATEQTKQKPKLKNISKAAKLKVLGMKEEGKTVAEISELLWIQEDSLKKFLKIKPATKKKDGLLLADNTTESIDDFIEEVKESQK